MSSLELEIQLVATVTALACAIPGVFLVLRRMALMSDAISHTVLLGIVLAFFVVRDLGSPLLIAGAAAIGVVTVSLVELVRGTGLMREDAAIGLVFPALFSMAVILISRFAGNVHLDTDAVLLGEIGLAPFRRFVVGGVDLGPRALVTMALILLVDVACITLFYKELKLTTFDPGLAAALGFSPLAVHYGFMGLVSITAVGAFDSVGSILVVALMVAPPAAAYLLTDRLPVMLVAAAALAVGAAIAGYWLAWTFDASIAGSMAVAAGVEFALVFLVAPERGLVAAALRRARQRQEFAVQLLTIHLLHHEGSSTAGDENREAHLHEHLRWSPVWARNVVGRAERRGLLVREGGGSLRLTPRGREVASDAMLP